MKSNGFALLIVISSAYLAGCSAVVPIQHDIVTPPQHWETSAVSSKTPLSPWIKDFNDPLLETLILEALINNQDLKASSARVEAAMAQARIAGADLYPEINGNFDAQRRRTNSENRNDVSSNYNSSLGVGVDVSWEVDLWGRLSSRAKAATLDFEVSDAEWQATQLSLAASVARAWFNLTEAQLQLKLVEQRITNLSDNLITIEEDFKLGLRGALDVYLARADVSGERARLATRKATVIANKRILEVLLGRYPKGLIDGPAELKPLETSIPSGLPSQLLIRRPDLIASQKALEASDQRVASAHANRFPRLSLTGNLGSRSDELSNLFNSDYLVWSVFSGLSAPLFDAGRLEAEEERARANAKEAEASYNQALLTAFQEVEEALINGQLLKEQEYALKQASEESIAAEDLAFEQYQSGLLDFITVLESQRRSFGAQSTEIEVRNLRLQNRINLYLALGGSFITLPENADRPKEQSHLIK